MKHIQIFAAFDKDVAEDIVRFGDFLHALNSQCKNIELSIFKNEKELCESLEQTNEQIDGKLNTCEYFLLILGSQNDEYILDKLNRAIENYAKTRGSPLVDKQYKKYRIVASLFFLSRFSLISCRNKAPIKPKNATIALPIMPVIMSKINKVCSFL